MDNHVADLLQVLQTSIAEIERVMIGQKQAIRHAVAACIAGGHVLLEDVPGTGKTTLAFTLAKVFGLSFTRIQGTPDLLPGDIIGSSVYQPQSGTFKFYKGPIFTQLLLMDEVNRATPRTQAALLEAMAERQVSAEGETYQLDDVFFVIATANPLESQGVFPLPEAQIDRFLIELRLGYGSEDDELQLIERMGVPTSFEPQLRMTRAQILKLQSLCKQVTVATEIARYIVRLCRATRNHESVVVGASPRSILMLTAFAKALAFIYGREYVIPDDVKEAWIPVMRHRLRMHVEWRVDSPAEENRDILMDILKSIKTPGEHFIEV